MIPILAFSGAFLFPGLLYYAETHGKRTAGLILKAISSLTFVIVGYVCGRASSLPDFARLFLIGEILGAIGDVVINLGPWFKGSNLPFFAGGAFFLAGHVLYITALIPFIRDSLLLAILVSVLVSAAVCLLLFLLTKGEKLMRLLTTAYILVVCVFFAFTLSAFIKAPSWERISLVLGAGVFLFSDFDLMLNMMGKKKWKFVSPCMYIYYPAQIILALCLYWYR